MHTINQVTRIARVTKGHAKESKIIKLEEQVCMNELAGHKKHIEQDNNASVTSSLEFQVRGTLISAANVLSNRIIIILFTSLFAIKCTKY